jgi:ribosome-associated translation inhibitor RaiA/cold shock CspA family protein
MQSQPHVTFRGLEPSPAIESLIAERRGRLEKFHPGIVACDVIVEAAQKRKVHGRLFSVRVNIGLPGPDISVTRGVAQGDAQEDVRLAINQAFSAVEKKLKEQRRTMGAVEVKHHPPVLHGEVSELEPELGWGMIRTDEGRSVYFQKDSLETGSWDAVVPGKRLRFREMDGEKGPYAIHVALMD